MQSNDNWTKSIILQCVLYFTLAKMEGKSRLEAVTSFLQSNFKYQFSDNLTVGMVYAMAAAGGYPE